MTAEAVTREQLEIRWQMAMTRPRRFASELRISQDNSKRYYRIQNALEELGAMLVDEVHDDEMDNIQGTSLRECIEEIWLEIESRLIDWALATETARKQRRESAA